MAAGDNKKRLVAAIGAAAAALVLAFVPRWEGTVLKTYKDPIGIITACEGHTGPELRMGQTFTPAECGEMTAGDLVWHARGVQDCTAGTALTDGEVAAWTSFAFNVGVTAFCKSTAARLINAGQRRAACDELFKWNRAGGRVFQGLVNRRAAEHALCIRDIS